MFERLKWLLPALTLVLAMAMLSVSSRHQGRGASPASVLLEVVGPVESALSAVVGRVDSFWRNYLYLVGVREENRSLREVVGRQSRQLAELGEYKAANERLTALLGLRNAYPNLVMKPAHILAWDPSPWFRSIIISLGSRDGLAVDQAVVHDRGVVGRVVDTSPNYARVLLATDFNSSIDAFVQRTRAAGILSGDGARPMRLNYIRKDEDVRPGDLVVTSGLAGLFPRGLPLGTVSRVNRESADMFVAIEVIPQVTFERLEEVMVVLNQGPPVDWLSLAPGLRPLLEEEAEEARRRAQEEARTKVEGE